MTVKHWFALVQPQISAALKLGPLFPRKRKQSSIDNGRGHNKKKTPKGVLSSSLN